jgi:hypothetical protein
MTAISILQNHILETKALIRILERKDIRTVSNVYQTIDVCKNEIKELEDAIAILSKVSN